LKQEIGQKPETIVTDGHKGMTDAIKVVFPKAQHIILWHLTENVQSHGAISLQVVSLSALINTELLKVLKLVGQNVYHQWCPTKKLGS